jgi:hypothetical protein
MQVAGMQLKFTTQSSVTTCCLDVTCSTHLLSTHHACNYTQHYFSHVTLHYIWQTGALDELNDPNWAVKVRQPLNKVGQFLPKVYRFQTTPVFGAYDGLVSSTINMQYNI